MGRHRLHNISECIINIPPTVSMQLTEADYDVQLTITDITVNSLAEFYLMNKASSRLLKTTIRYRIQNFEIIRIDNPKYKDFNKLQGVIADGIRERLIKILFYKE
jgi:hypothetical protein